MIQRFQDREDAGRQLASRLRDELHEPVHLVLGLPRGGVIVAYQVAEALNIPLDIVIVRKLGVPWQKELAMGAVSEGGGYFINQALVRALNVSEIQINETIKVAKREIQRQQKLYRGSLSFPQVKGKRVILVDDGLATGATMRAALKFLKQRKAAGIVVAIPVGSLETCEALRQEVDEVICLLMPESLDAIGYWYESFEPTDDEEVLDRLVRSRSKFDGS